MKKIKHVIVQAGGKGTRMGFLTQNKPKCLISINGKPLLYHLSKAFPEAHFYIVTDYKKDVLYRYLKINPPEFPYVLVETNGRGTCAGLEKARMKIPIHEPFAIVWSDLLFTSEIMLPDIEQNYVGLTNEFKCRWSFRDESLIESPSDKAGVMGLFFIGKPDILPRIPENGEFVRFLSENSALVELVPQWIEGVKEIGTLEAFEKLKSVEVNNRFFNSVSFEKNRVIKMSRNHEFKKLIEDEINWYKFVSKHNYKYIPKIFEIGNNRIEMEKIDGLHPYDVDKNTEKDKILEKIFASLDELHSIEKYKYDREIVKDVYVKKTYRRLSKISLLIPNKENEFYVVNGKKVRNLLNERYFDDISKAFKEIKCSEVFTVIHGDPTFSNMKINENGDAIFFDPRGYFGSLKIFGDPMYDFAKLYYSVIGNYDQFNKKNFRISVRGNEVDVKINSNGWEELEYLFKEKFGDRMKDLKILHALIWLSLTGYVLDDVDSILGSYFHGLELFEESIK
ncbi:NTP transferase domain-containing protein [Mesoaciditoga lauensis]|uniref:NTP transferase domain-containing protein n=1 Tax=Mesoaciditoga lauensis TaxID=1495039 RepID=UPI0005680FD5|nr:NTP transferase domain-containing protein [Mesoaciditoga lauensis]